MGPNENKIFITPSGFIEQHYVGEQTPQAVLEAIKKLKAWAKKIESQGQPVLILEDVSRLEKIDFLNPKMGKVRKASADAVRVIEFERAAVYGPLRVQVIVNTLALIAGKRDKLKVFDDRADAIKWLLGKK